MLKTIIGAILFLMACGGLAITIVAMVATAILAKRGANYVYIMATTNMAVDLIPLLTTICYLGPSVMADSFLFEGGRDSRYVIAIGTAFMFSWYTSTLTSIIVALNRMAAICFNRSTFFNSPSVYKLVFGVIPLALFMAINSQYLLPCCDFACDHRVLSYTYREIENVTNYSNLYLDLPLNATSSATCIICYIIIFAHIKRSHNQIGVTLSAQALQRRKREIALALQFVYITTFYLFSWVFFRVFPILMYGSEVVYYYAVITTCGIICFSANGVVYLTRNSEVQRVVRNVSESKIQGTYQSNPASQKTTSQTPN